MKILFFILLVFFCKLEIKKICDYKSKTFWSEFLIYRFGLKNNSAYCNFPATNQNSSGQNNTIPQITVTVSPAYNIPSNWMDYMRRNMQSPSSISQTNATACDGTETGWYNSCIHLGEIKKLEVTNISNCDGVTATDKLQAFNWVCVLQSGKVFIYSTGLKYEKNLSDLIDFNSPSFLDNSITVSKEGQSTPITISSDNKWWTNPIQIQNTASTLSTSGTIYIVNVNPPNGLYTSGARKVALVVKPGNRIQNSGAEAWTNIINSEFGWIEGEFTTVTDSFVITNVSDSLLSSEI
jgi:hypothetical protein